MLTIQFSHIYLSEEWRCIINGKIVWGEGASCKMKYQVVHLSLWAMKGASCKMKWCIYLCEEWKVHSTLPEQGSIPYSCICQFSFRFMQESRFYIALHNANYNTYGEHKSQLSFVIVSGYPYRRGLGSKCCVWPTLFFTSWLHYIYLGYWLDTCPHTVKLEWLNLLQLPLASLKCSDDRSFQKAAAMLDKALPVHFKVVHSYSSV